jgi:tripartite-type tricarboxylate transporter receptor subunit TctC
MRAFSFAMTLASSLAAATGVVRAESVEDFYRGKTITMYVGTGENSGIVGAYPRTIAQVIKKYIPGHPNVIVTHMPGAGGIKLANYIQTVAAQDGLSWAFITRGFMLAPLIRIPGAQFDPTAFNWIGSPARTVSIGAVWTANTKVRSLGEAMQQEVVLGATAPNQDTAIFPKALNQLIGTRFRIVTGYSSVGEVDLAMQRGELQGKVGFTWSSLASGSSANWLRDGLVKVIVQLGLEKSPQVPADVPLALDAVTSPEDRKVLEILCAPSATGFPSFMGAGVPPERVQAIRDAFDKVMRDPEFVDLVRKQDMDVDPIDAAEISRIVRSMYASPAAAVARVREMVGTN